MQNNKRRWGLYQWLNRDGKEIRPEDVITTGGFKGFFYRYRLSFSKLLSVNILMVLGNIFLIFLVLTFAGYTKQVYFRPTNDLSILQNGLDVASGEAMSAFDLSFFTQFSQRMESASNTPLTYLFWGLAAITFLTFGCVNAGTSYLLRNLVKGDPVFPLSDFWYAVKRNWKQAIPVGIIDGLICLFIPLNIYSMLAGGDYFASLLLWVNVVLFILYSFMRFYLYVLMITFDLKITKIFKNAFILALLGVKRNIVAFIGILLLGALEFLFLVAGNGVLLPLAVALPLLVFFSHASFMGTFASYHVIKKYMIDTLPQEERVRDEIGETQPE